MRLMNFLEECFLYHLNDLSLPVGKIGLIENIYTKNTKCAAICAMLPNMPLSFAT